MKTRRRRTVDMPTQPATATGEPCRQVYAQALRDAADIAAACVTCGKPHQPHPVPHDGAKAVTWADPDDGHAYRRRQLDDAINAIHRRANEQDGRQ